MISNRPCIFSNPKSHKINTKTQTLRRKKKKEKGIVPKLLQGEAISGSPEVEPHVVGNSELEIEHGGSNRTAEIGSGGDCSSRFRFPARGRKEFGLLFLTAAHEYSGEWREREREFSIKRGYLDGFLLFVWDWEFFVILFVCNDYEGKMMVWYLVRTNEMYLMYEFGAGS